MIALNDHLVVEGRIALKMINLPVQNGKRKRFCCNIQLNCY